MTTILVTTDFYLPGYRAGGPIRSIANLVDGLGDEFQFRIITRNRDLGVSVGYPNIQTEIWHVLGKGHVIYLPDKGYHLWGLQKILRATNYDLLYLNGFFAPLTRAVLTLRASNAIPKMPVVVAPRGEFSKGALSIKAAKKTTYIQIMKAIGLYRHVLWQASSEFEQADIESYFANDIKMGHSTIHIAPNLFPRLAQAPPSYARYPKKAGSIQIVFLSRIARMKNLNLAVQLLQHIPGDIKFDIYGPIEDDIYWQECQRQIKELPTNVDVSYNGVVTPDDIQTILAKYHLLLLPTHGENFGHVILESLSAGCPVLISDQTPWRNLPTEHAGWEHKLSTPEAFQETLRAVVNMNQEEWQTWSTGARKLAEVFTTDKELIDASRKMFQLALAPK